MRRALLAAVLAGVSSTAALSTAALSHAAARAQIVIAVPTQSNPTTPGAALTPLRPTRSTVQREAFAEGQVSISAWSPWPLMLYQGYFPVIVEVENATAGEVDLDLSLTRGWNAEDSFRVEDSVTVEAGTRARREYLMSATRNFAGGVNLEISSRGEKRRLFNVGPTLPPDATAYPVLYAYDPAASSAAEPTPGAEAAWGEAAASAPPAQIPDFETGSQIFDPWSGRIAVPGSTGGVGRWHPQFTPIELDALSARSEAYSSLKGVVLDVRGALPRAEVLDALFQWTRLGGCLVIHGPDAERVARSMPALVGWMEERFLLSQHERNRVYACAQGALVLVESPLLTDHVATGEAGGAGGTNALDAFTAINDGLVHPRQLTRSPSMWGPLEGLAALPGMDLPYRGFAVLLVIFALTIGPVNLIVIRRLKRPALLLVTVPALALLFSIGLILYGVLAQGLGTRACANSVTWLDQRAHHASTLEVRSVFAGLPHGSGWRAGPGTSVHVLPDASRRMTNGTLLVDTSEGTAYRGDFLPVRREVRNAFLTDRAARARLEVRTSANGVEVENGLGATIQELLVRTSDDESWYASAPIAEGARATLKLVNADEGTTSDTLFGWTAVIPSRKALVPGSYVARLRSSPFTDDCGVSYDEEQSQHIVYGILDAPAVEEERR